MLLPVADYFRQRMADTQNLFLEQLSRLATVRKGSLDHAMQYSRVEMNLSGSEVGQKPVACDPPAHPQRSVDVQLVGQSGVNIPSAAPHPANVPTPHAVPHGVSLAPSRFHEVDFD